MRLKNNAHKKLRPTINFFLNYAQQVSSYQENKHFLTDPHTSKKDFSREYRKLYHDKGKAEELNLLVLNELKNSISEGNINTFKKLSNLINYISEIEDQVSLKRFYDNANNPIKSTNLVILACKYNNVEILEYLFSSDNKILNNLSVGVGRLKILPDDRDEELHNAFYYAIRAGDIKLLDTLINKWPGNHFAVHLEELDETLSRTYEELKLKNVQLSDEVEIFVENKLLNLRFFSDTFEQNPNVKSGVNSIIERIDLVLDNINLLYNNYSSTQEVDEKFLYMATFIAQNIHILKRQLKSTYDRLPWEEIEFCLVCFVSSHTKQQEINLFSHATLNKSKIITHLINFSSKLEYEKRIITSVNIKNVTDLPKISREKVVSGIISNCPEFEELYKDFQQIRDIYSLDKINYYIQLALSADPQKREGQLVITRVLQVIGEYLKNTLESPNLSSSTSELLLLTLPKNTRKVIIDLRNSLSHAYSLSKRTEIEENTDVNFFIGVQNDTKKVGDVIVDAQLRKKIKVFRILLTKIINSENVDEIKEVAVVFNNVKLDKIIREDFKTVEHQKLKKLIKELSDSITEQTNFEKQFFDEINVLIGCKETQSEKIRCDFVKGFIYLERMCTQLNDSKFEHKRIEGMKFYANKLLEIITPKIESKNMKQIVELTWKISWSVRVRSSIQCPSFNQESHFRKDHNNVDRVSKLFWEIFDIAEFELGSIKWIEELRESLSGKGFFIPMYNQDRSCSATKYSFKKQLSSRLSELKFFLTNNALSSQVIEKCSSYKIDKELQAVVEMLVLDIMSILGSSKNCLENNLLFLDDNTPLLTGKCLRNHLAHDNTLVDVLLSDPSLAIILNANKLTEENVTWGKQKIGKLLIDDPSKLKDKYNRGLDVIANQKQMFIALEEGNLEIVKNCLKRGAEIHARNINNWTTLHFAAKGSCLEVVKFVLDKNVSPNVKDINGQSPLHVAAVYGRKNIVEFFVKEAGLLGNDLDSDGKTPLHIASQNGHSDAVKILIKYNADTTIRDVGGHSCLHYAVKNNHVDVAKFLLNKNKDVNICEAMGGYTLLHTAAENGHLDLLNFLLKKGANVNARTDNEVMPLNLAALNGHLEIVKILIVKGADVNAMPVGGHTSLHCAIRKGHEKIAKVLLKNGAKIDAVDETLNTSLHYAAGDGNEELVKILLENKANANVATVAGKTPLHLAAQVGPLNIVTALLKHDVNIHAKDRYNATPFHYAAKSGHVEIAQLLIEKGANKNAKANYDFTPLHLASREGHKEVADLLIKYHANVYAKDIMGSTALHAAAVSCKIDVMDLLIKNEANINAKNNYGITPLHGAALTGHQNSIDFLIKHKAEVNTKDNYGNTPLHVASAQGHKVIVDLLIENMAQIDARDINGNSALHLAVEAGHMEVIKCLLDNGANVNAKNKSNQTLLLFAIKYNRKDIVQVLVANGAEVNEDDGGEPLKSAILLGFKDIVEILLKYNAHVNVKDDNNFTPLHIAVTRGNKEIVNSLVSKGANIHAANIQNITPLDIAAQNGHEEILQFLIDKGANVNVKAHDGTTPLHAAAVKGNSNVVKVLINNKASVNVTDNMNRTALELAVSYGHLEVVKIILQHRKVNVNTKGNDGYTLLHIASQQSNLEIVKYLLNEGSDIKAKNASGSKPIHIAAREGFKDIVEYYLSKGVNINEPGTANQTVLHYAGMKGNLEIVKYLLAQGADISAADDNSVTPMHIAAWFGNKDVVEVLLQNGSVYNVVDKLNSFTPLQMSTNIQVSNLLASTEKLFGAVKRNCVSEVVYYINAGASVNANNANSGILLHYAAWKGYHEIVNLLLKNKANPNSVGKKGCTPLHYAAKFSRLEVVVALLSNGAVYNAISDCGKIPLDFTSDKSITKLLTLVSESFKNVKDGNTKVIQDLNKIKDIGTVKALMCARNKENETLVVAAVHHKFPKVEQLKQISQGDISTQIDKALVLLNQGNCETALNILKNAFEKRKEILGPDSPATLDVQTHIANVLYKQGAYHEALKMFEEIFQKQKEILGINDKSTLSVRSGIALVLHRQGKDDEAYKIFQEVYQKQKEILEPNHSDTLETQFHLALVLDKLGKHEEALTINREVFEKYKKTHGVHHPVTVIAQNNIAMVLNNLGKFDEAIKIYKDVLKKKKTIFGINHSDTLRTLHNIAGTLAQQKKYHEASEAFKEVLNVQKKVLGQNHPETLDTQYNLAGILFSEGKWNGALKAFKECLDLRISVYGPNHPTVLDTLNKIEHINNTINFLGLKGSDVPQHLQEDIKVAAYNGDTETVQQLLKNGANANDEDIEGRTPLHYAISNGHISIVSLLLINGADVTQVTNKGNTPIHTAASKNYKEIIDVLFQHVPHNKLKDFIDAKTISGGTSSLHVAAKNGSLEIVKCLLKHGATYNIKNNEGKTPIDLSKEQKVRNLLQLIDESFEDTRNGHLKVISKLRKAQGDEIEAIINSRNNLGNTLLQVAVINKHQNISSKLLQMVKKN